MGILDGFSTTQGSSVAKPKETDLGQLLTDIVSGAVSARASDIHIEPTEKHVRIRYRVDGMLRQVRTVDKSLEQALVFKIKIVAKVRTDEHFAPQDGRIRFNLADGKHLDTRISILPTSKGEKVEIRLLSQDSRTISLLDLGITDKDMESVKKGYLKPFGMILVSGPTGSGKTTTLYSILKLINSDEINISTIEDPVEYDLDGVNHVQVNAKTELTFAAGLRSLLRQDPDVIMIGEIRDSETAKIAINAALTGHLMLSTIHTNDAVTTIPRLIDMGVEPFLVASTVNLVIAQRLARRLCPHCRKKYTFSTFEYDSMLLKIRPDIAAHIKVGDELYRATGCEKCGNSGYIGRVGLFEILEINEAIRRGIADRVSTEEIYHLARKNGLTLMVEDGVNKLREGVISLTELTRVTALKE